MIYDGPVSHNGNSVRQVPALPRAGVTHKLFRHLGREGPAQSETNEPNRLRPVPSSVHLESRLGRSLPKPSQISTSCRRPRESRWTGLPKSTSGNPKRFNRSSASRRIRERSMSCQAQLAATRAQSNIFRRSEIRAKRQLLMDDAYAIGRSMMRISPAHPASAKQDFAGVGLKLTTENIDESALTRTIFSYQAMDFPSAGSR